MLKAIPNKNAGFIILLTSIFILFLFGEIRNLTTFLLSINNPFYLLLVYSFFIIFILFIWIGTQFPQDNFISYGRILTLYYYFLIICILFSVESWPIYKNIRELVFRSWSGFRKQKIRLKKKIIFTGTPLN
jgi:CBS domain containing-hemolysin-like protein